MWPLLTANITGPSIATLQKENAEWERSYHKLQAENERHAQKIAELTKRLCEQLCDTRKLSHLLDNMENAAARLRSSRRWKLANPGTAILAKLFPNKVSLGYGHLEKIVASYLQWRTSRPEIAKIDDQIKMLAFSEQLLRRKSPLRDLAITAEQEFWKIKVAHRPKSFWYPYLTLRYIPILEQLLATVGLDLLQLCRGSHGKIADIGSADTDLAFFMEKMGFSVDVIENRLTNFNLLEGARIMKEALGSSVTIREIDLDSQFPLLSQKYDAIFLLGILYHLKNPFFILERLARMTKYCFLSTRIASQTPDGHRLSPYPLVYLLDPQECNNDNTNFWIFSDQGLKRLIKRTGWDLIAYTTTGDTTDSDPADPDKDQRALCALRSNVFQ
jgi:tRNA (mo5U34)-methyltransferase